MAPEGNRGALIEELGRRHRREPSEALARELVRLRLAEGAARRDTARPGVPPVAPDPDPFAYCPGLPEIDSAGLTAESLAAGLLCHGGLLVRGLYRDHQLATLLALAEQQEEADRGDNRPLGCTPLTLCRLLEIQADCGLLAAVSGYMNAEALLFAERAKLRQHRARRDSRAALPWHQDASFFGGRLYGVNCWAAVTPCGEDNPGLSIVPRRQDGFCGWDPDRGLAPLDYGNRLPQEELARAMAGSTPVHCRLQAGDALLFDEMTLHRTEARPWRLPRQIVTISWFFRASAFPGWGTPLAL